MVSWRFGSSVTNTTMTLGRTFPSHMTQRMSVFCNSGYVAAALGGRVKAAWQMLHSAKPLPFCIQYGLATVGHDGHTHTNLFLFVSCIIISLPSCRENFLHTCLEGRRSWFICTVIGGGQSTLKHSDGKLVEGI